MDPRFQQHVPPTGPPWPSPHDPAYGGPGADTRRLSPLPQQGAPMPSPSDSRPGYPSLAPGGHPLHGTSPASAPPSAYPHLQGLPNMPPPISEPDHLAAGMAHMGLQSSPNREVSVGLLPDPRGDTRRADRLPGVCLQTPDSLAPQAVVPARGKRAARAYHDQGVSPAPQPTPSGSHLPPGQPSYFPPQQFSESSQPPPSNGMMQNPHYQSAPPSSAPLDPRSAPPASYQNDGPGIPQPPHTAGQRIPGKQRIRIDPDHIPSPVNVQEADQQLYRTEPYLTCSRTPAPLASTDFVAVDQGTPQLVRGQAP